MPPKETKKPGAPAVAVAGTTPQAVATYDWSQGGPSGFENVNAEDLGIPFLSIIQKGSAQYDRDHDEYATKHIEGCDVGDIFNTVSNTVVASAGEPVEVIPCSFQKLFMEWKTREAGGGIVKTHTSPAILAECQRNEKGHDVLRNGNIIVTTAYFYCIAIVDGERSQCMISFTSTQLKKSKQWLNMMMSLKLPNAQGAKYTPPMFSHSYLLSTVAEKNEKGTWRGWLIQHGKMVTDPILIADSMNYAKRAGTVQKQLNSPPPSEGENEV